MATEKQWPGLTGEAHPEVFNSPPSFPTTLKPGMLTEAQFQQYFHEGYVVVDDFFKLDDLEPVKAAMEVLVDDLANKLYKGGKIKKLYKDHGLFERLTMLENEFPGANIILHKLGRLPQAFRDLWGDDRLLNMVEQILGTANIIGNPNWNIRTKTPRNEATTVPWHQDAAYLDNDAYQTMVVSAWIPMLDTTEHNGCMQMMRRGHKTGRVATHQCCHGGTWYIMLEPDEMQKTLDIDPEADVVTVPVPYGGVLLFNNLIPHHSLNNLSKQIRWSLDLRWSELGKPVGFFGIKDGVVMRKEDDRNVTIDWESFDAIDRHVEASKALDKVPVDEFDTTISGMWMTKWEIVHMNEHTEAMKDGKEWTGEGLAG